MKFTVDSLSLSEAVNKVIKAISIKKNNPVLECIKLSAHGSYLTLTATDMELSIEKNTPLVSPLSSIPLVSVKPNAL